MRKGFNFIKNIITILWERHHLIVPPKYYKKYFNSFKKKLSMKREFLNPFIIKEYNMWLNEKKEIDHIKLKYNPLISFVIPVYNIEPEFLEDCIESILSQTYQNFEICLADDHSTNEDTINKLKEYEKNEKIKVVYRKENGHISKATNSALEIATGEYIALMDDDDKLTKDALYKMVYEINKDRDIDFIYSDEDKEEMDTTLCEPHFKSDFSIHSFYGGNFICHFTIIKRDLLDKVGNFKSEYVGAQDFDLFLRCTEKAKKIKHVPEILYHWRKVPGSTADTIENKDYAIDNGKKAVEDALKRRNKDAYVTTPLKVTHYIVHYNFKDNPKVTIILTDCTKRIYNSNIEELKKLTYKNVEYIKLEKDLNQQIEETKSEYIMIVSGKIKIRCKDMIEEMIGYASQEDIGVVGPKIYRFGKLVKSAGLILSDENIYIDAFKDYFTDSVGLYGRLVVPYSYAAVSERFIMFKKDKYDKVGGFRDDMNYILSSIDFQQKLLKKGYENVLLSYIYVHQKDYKRKRRYEIDENEKDILRKKWNLDDNKYYNKNLSKTYSYMLGVNENEK